MPTKSYIEKLKLVPFLWLFISLALGVFLGIWSFLLLSLAYFKTYRPYVFVAIFGALINIYFHSHSVIIPNEERYSVTCRIGEKLYTDLYEVDVIECTSTKDTTKHFDSFQSVIEFYEPSENFINRHDVVKIDVFTKEIHKTRRYKSVANNLLQKGYSQKLIAYPNKDFKVYKHKTSDSFIQQARQEVNRKLSKLLKFSESSAILHKMITGEANELSIKEETLFRDAGIAHILAISGLHIGILYLILSGVLFFMNISYKLKLLKIALISILLFGYVWFIDFQPSALRAVFMITLLSFGALRAHSKMMKYNILLGTAFVMLLYDTTLLYDISFQLSFTAVGGIMYGISKYLQHIKIKNKVINYILLSCVVTMSAQIATLPLVLYYFGYVSTISLLSNMLIAPLVTPLLIFVIAYLSFGLDFIGEMACIILDFIIKIATWFTDIPYSNFKYIDFQFEELVAMYTAYFLIFVGIELRNKEKKLSLRE
ncbi:MAG: ComEC/Rec2 family competence protein [Rikenellaceae bacterium]